MQAMGKIHPMRYRRSLLVLLCTLSAIGFGTVYVTFPSDLSTQALSGWWTFLVLFPLILSGAILAGWVWAAMVCVAYGTIGLALDLSTVTGILGGTGGTQTLLAFSIASAAVNLAVIIVGGLVFWTWLRNSPRPESRPPNPQPPSSSSAI